MGNVVRLSEARAAREGTPVATRIPCVVQAAPGAVAFVVPPSDAETEWWLSPEQAESLALDLWNSAREARQQNRPK
jgi:hypothetical protein